MAHYQNSSNDLFINTPVTSVAASYAASLSDYIIEVSDTTASRTITLPAPSTPGATSNVGKVLIIKDSSGAALSGGNPIIVAPASGTIDGVASINIAQDYGSIMVYCNGTSWFSDAETLSAPFAWFAKAAGTALIPGQGYWSTAATAQNFPLPAAASTGTIVELAQSAAGAVTITQAIGQSVRFGNSSTTPGVTGSLSSSAQGDAIKLICITANTTWQVVTGAVGNWLIV